MTVGKSTIGLNTLGIDTIGNENIPAGGISPPPFVACSVLTLSNAQPPFNATVTYDSAPNTNRYTVTSTTGAPSQAFSFDPVNTFSLNTGAVVVAEVYGEQPSVANNGGGAGIGVLDVSGFSAFQGIKFDYGTGSNGQFSDVFGNPIGAANKPYPTTWPYVLKIEVAENGTATYRDNNGQSGLLSSLGAFTGITCGLFSLSSAPNTAGSSVSNTLNGGSQPFQLPLDNPSAESWCNQSGTPLPPFAEKFYTVVSAAPWSVLNNNDNAEVVHNGSSSGNISSSLGYSQAAPNPVGVTQVNNVVEIEVISVSGDPFQSSSSLVLQQTSSGEGITLENSSFSNQKQLEIANNVSFGSIRPLQVGDVFFIIYISSNNTIRLGYKLTGEDSIIFDEFDANGGPNAGATFLGVNAAQASGSARFKVNGLDSSLVVSDYPTGTTGYDGSALPSKTAPEVIDIKLEQNPFVEALGSGSSPTGVVNITGSTFTCNSDTSNCNFFALGNRFIQPTMGNIAIEAELTTLSASAREGLFLKGINSSSPFSEISILDNGSNVVIRVRDQFGTSTDTIISAGSFSSGDVVGIEYNPTTGVAIGHYKPSGLPEVTPVTSTATPFSSAYMPQVGGAIIPSGNTFVITQHWKAADMVLTYSSADDLEGNPAP